MLKLMKYEFIHSMRTFVLSYVVFLAMCVIYPFLANRMIIPVVSYLVMFFNMGFILLIIGIVIALFVSLFINFYRSMFKKPAYLSLTLPVSSTKLILSKVIMSMIWLIIGFLVLTIGLFIMSMITGLINHSLSILDVLKTLSYFMKSVIEYSYYHVIPFLKMIFMVICGLVYVVGGIYFSLTVAHTKWLRKHRLILGIALYIIMIILVEFIRTNIFAGLTYSDSFLVIQSLYYLIIGALMIFGTIYIFDHHIEIE